MKETAWSPVLRGEDVCRRNRLRPSPGGARDGCPPPYLDDYWREMVSVRALDRLNLSLTSYPQNSPLSCRPDWLLPGGAKAGSSLEAMQDHVLDGFDHAMEF